MDGLKRCRACETEKPPEAFYRTRRICKECRSAQGRRWVEANRERVRETFRRYEARHPERRRAKERKYRAANLEKCRLANRVWAAKNKAKKNDIYRKYAATEYGKAARYIRERRRRDRIDRKATRDVALLRAAIVRAGYCEYCAEFKQALTLDHVIPISRGGSDEPSNWAAACGLCNSSKGNRTPAEWVPACWRQRMDVGIAS